MQFSPIKLLFFLVLQVALLNSTRGSAIEGPFVHGSGNWTTLPNGSFETGDISQWTDLTFGKGSFSATSEIAFDEVFSAQAIPFAPFSGAGFALAQTVPVSGGQDYVLSGFTHTGNLSAGQIRLDINGVSFDPFPFADIGISEWQFIWDTVSVPSGVNSVTVRLVRDGNGVTPDEIAFFDEIAFTPIGSFTAPTVIPEPSVMVLLVGMGIFPVLLFNRRRQASK